MMRFRGLDDHIVDGGLDGARPRCCLKFVFTVLPLSVAVAVYSCYVLADKVCQCVRLCVRVRKKKPYGAENKRGRERWGSGR